MPVRVRYRSGELSEGVVETFEQANAYRMLEDNTLELHEQWEDEQTGKLKYAKVGLVHRDRWESVVVIERAES